MTTSDPPSCVAQFSGAMPWVVIVPCEEGGTCELPEEPGTIDEVRTCLCESPEETDK